MTSRTEFGEIGVSSGNTEHNERRAGERRKDRAAWMGAADGGAVILYDGVQQADDRRPRKTPDPVHRKEHGPVLFWTPDGTRHAGRTPQVNGDFLFIESEQMVPVGTDITVSLTTVEEQSGGQEIAEGTVVWHCPRGDEFKHQGGVGVRLKRRWPKGPGLEGGLKEPT